jgi:hypothetical protein
MHPPIMLKLVRHAPKRRQVGVTVKNHPYRLAGRRSYRFGAVDSWVPVRWSRADRPGSSSSHCQGAAGGSTMMIEPGGGDGGTGGLTVPAGAWLRSGIGYDTGGLTRGGLGSAGSAGDCAGNG